MFWETESHKFVHETQHNVILKEDSHFKSGKCYNDYVKLWKNQRNYLQ